MKKLFASLLLLIFISCGLFAENVTPYKIVYCTEITPKEQIFLAGDLLGKGYIVNQDSNGGGYQDSYLLFNLRNKYLQFTATLGYSDAAYSSYRADVTFYVDNEEVKTVKVTPSDYPHKIEIDLNFGSQLRVVFNDPSKIRTTASTLILTDIDFN